MRPFEQPKKDSLAAPLLFIALLLGFLFRKQLKRLYKKCRRFSRGLYTAR